MIKCIEQQLQKAIDHAQREPTIPCTRIAALYEVNRTTLPRRVAGTQRNFPAAHWEAQVCQQGKNEPLRAFLESWLITDFRFPMIYWRKSPKIYWINANSLRKARSEMQVWVQAQYQKTLSPRFMLLGQMVPSPQLWIQKAICLLSRAGKEGCI